MLKVLIIQSSIKSYRIPIFNLLAKYVDLTVMYDKGKVPEGALFNTAFVPVKQVGCFKKFHRCNILSYANNFDVVIMMFDPSYLTTHLLSRSHRRFSLIYWGIGVAAARNIRYDSCQKTADILCRLVSKADAALFYSDYPVKKYCKMGVPEEKLFVADNTVEVIPIESKEKSNIIFVGSLYKAKRIFELLENYYKAYNKNKNIPCLNIIGDGEDYEGVKSWIYEHELQEKISLVGAVFDENILASYFSKSFMCISPDQAGLSVLKSFGYGVPFVTHKDAITGGERFNIVNGENGILFDSFNEIEDIILDCSENPQKYIDMGNNAYRFYSEHRTVENMVSGFKAAIEYVTSLSCAEWRVD